MHSRLQGSGGDERRSAAWARKTDGGEGKMIGGGVRWGEKLQKCHSNLTFKKCPPGWSGRRCSWLLVEKEGEEAKCV